MRWVRWAVAIVAGLALAGAVHLDSGGSGGGALPEPSTLVGVVPPTAATTTFASPTAEPSAPIATGDGAPVASQVAETERPPPASAGDTSDRSPVPWLLFAALVVAAGAAVFTWQRRRRRA